VSDNIETKIGELFGNRIAAEVEVLEHWSGEGVLELTWKTNAILTQINLTKLFENNK
jgi:hypothetical protein